MKMKKLALVVAVLFAMSLVLLTGCGSSSSSSSSSGTAASSDSKSGGSKELVVVSWGGALQDVQREVMFKPFEEKYGVKVKDVSPTDYGKFKAMVSSGNTEWDVVDADADFVPRAIKENLIDKLDFNVIDKTNLEADLNTDYSVGAELYSYAMAYNTDMYANGTQPKNWTEFWDTTKFPGKRSLWKYAPGTMEIALLADGVDMKSLYPLDIDRAFKSLDKLKSNIQVWWTTGAQPAQLLTDKEIGLAAAWNGRITTAKQQGAKIDVEFNQSVLMADVWVCPKGAPHKDLAMKFIDFVTKPEQQAAMAKKIPYGPINEKAYDLIDDATKATLASSPDKRDKQVVLDVKYWVDNYDKVNDKFQQWLIN